MTYFHTSHEFYQVGDIIPAGKWGKGYHVYDPAERYNWLMLARELLMEKVRLELFPTKPSRMKGAFACQTLDELNRYCERYDHHANKYEVDLVDPSLPHHVGDYSYACHWRSGVNYLSMEQLAVDYWHGKIVDGEEFLTLSSLRVLRVL